MIAVPCHTTGVTDTHPWRSAHTPTTLRPLLTASTAHRSHNSTDRRGHGDRRSEISAVQVCVCVHSAVQGETTGGTLLQETLPGGERIPGTVTCPGHRPPTSVHGLHRPRFVLRGMAPISHNLFCVCHRLSSVTSICVYRGDTKCNDTL